MKILKTICIVIATLTVSSCTTGNGEETTDAGGINTRPTITASLKIGTRSMNTSNAPAGFDTDGINERGSDNELINSYFVIFVHADGSNNGRIASIITRDPGRTDAVQWEDLETKIPEGHYTIYAFANISQSDVETAAKTSFYAGGTMPDLSNVAWQFAPTRNSSTLVPMSNKISVSFSSHANPNYAIEVVRMIGKVQFYFRNVTDNPLSVIDYKITPLSNAGYLFSKSDAAPVIPSTANTDITFNAGLSETEALQVPVNTDTYTTSPAFWFYTAESSITTDIHPTGRYVMTFSLKRKYGTGEVVEEQRYSMTPNIFSYIRRNQYIIQPITFTDWVIEPQARFYPPIGGYPEVELEDGDSYRECYARFISPADGVFVINPFLRNLAEPDRLVYLEDQTYVKDYDIIVDDIDGIFKAGGAPAFKSGEILGTFNGTKGRAKITFNVTIKVSDTISRLYQRELYIVNK